MDYLVFEGKVFDIEWYFTEREESQAKEYFEELEGGQQDKAMNLFQLMGNVGKILNKEKFRNEGNHIYAFKIKPDRFLCFFAEDKRVIITNGFTKKTDKLPKNEKERAVSFMKDYTKRVKEGTYYEED